jgi:hypothetical protein
MMIEGNGERNSGWCILAQVVYAKIGMEVTVLSQTLIFYF